MKHLLPEHRVHQELKLEQLKELKEKKEIKIVLVSRIANYPIGTVLLLGEQTFGIIDNKKIIKVLPLSFEYTIKKEGYKKEEKKLVD